MPDDYHILYNAAGAAVGFRRHRWIYVLDGDPIGMTKGNHVFKLSGKYVGELVDDMVVDAGIEFPDTSGPGAPQNPGNISNPKSRDSRAGVNEVFERLLA